MAEINKHYKSDNFSTTIKLANMKIKHDDEKNYYYNYDIKNGDLNLTQLFKQEYDLKKNAMLNNQSRECQCPDCGKIFRTLTTLSQHRDAIHTSVRPFICELCSKTFNRISTLISHRKTHYDKKHFKCDICEKRFHQKGNLKHHMYTHTNIRPYRCSICNKGFNQKSNLTSHSQKAHSVDLKSISNSHCSSETETIINNNDQTMKAAVIIPLVQTEAMLAAKTLGQVPFAVLHLLEGDPVLMRLINLDEKSILRPVNSDDFSLLPTQERQSPVIVASVFQILNINETPEVIIFPPQTDCYKFELPENLISVNKIDDHKEYITAQNNIGISNFDPKNNGWFDGHSKQNIWKHMNDALIKQNDINIIDINNKVNENNENDNPKAIAVIQNFRTETNYENFEENSESDKFKSIATGDFLVSKQEQVLDKKFSQNVNADFINNSKEYLVDFSN